MVVCWLIASPSTLNCSVRSPFSTFALQRLWLSKLLFAKLSDAENDRIQGTVIQGSSLASTSLWLLLPLILVAFFSTSLQNNLWILESCSIVGLLPSRIILITASLSSNTSNKNYCLENWTFALTRFKYWKRWSFIEITGGACLVSRPTTVCPFRQRLKNQIPQIETGNPVQSQSSVQRDDFRFCWKVQNWRSFLAHPTHWNKCVTSEDTRSVQPEVDFESSRSPAKSESWNNPNLHCWAIFPTWQHCLYSQVWCIYEINRLKRLSQTLVHFVINRANSFTELRISSRPIRAKYKHLRTIWEHAFDNSPTDFVSSSLEVVGHRCKE